MKNAKKIFYVLLIMLLSTCGLLFGCGDKYKNLKVTSNLEDGIVLFFNDAENSTKTFEIRVDGASADISTKIKRPNMSVDGIVDVSMEHDENSPVTTITLTAINYGETDLIFTTEEGGKTLSVHVSCEYKIEGLAFNSQYKPYALVGQTVKLNSSKCLVYSPSSTTQKDVIYSMVGSYSGVSVLEDGTIITSETAQTGSFRVRATSTKNSNISVEFYVNVLRGVENIDVTFQSPTSEYQLSKDDALFFATNMLEESYKILNINLTPNDYDYTLEYRFLDETGNVTSTQNNLSNISSELFECDVIDLTHIGITAKNAGNEYLEVVAKAEGYEYTSSPYIFKLHSENIAKSVAVTDLEDNNQYDHYIIYDDYNGTEGKAIKVTVGGASLVQNTNFVIRLVNPDQDASKIKISTGRRDENGNLIFANLYTEGSTNFDVFANNTVLYLKADTNNITGDNDNVVLDFVAFGTMGLLGEESKARISFDLRNGVSNIILNDTYTSDGKTVLVTDSLVLVPVKEMVNGATLVGETQITLKIKASEYTESIYTNSTSSGYVLKNNIVTYENSIRDGNDRYFVFTLYGVSEGVYTLTFFTPNGRVLDVKIRVFVKLNSITATTASVEQNSDIGEINYNTENNLPTLNGGSITIKLGGNVALNLNSYLGSYLRGVNFQNLAFSFEDDGNQSTTVSSIVRIDNTNCMIGYSEGKTKVTVRVSTWDNSESGTNLKEYTLSFNLEVYVAIQNIVLSAKNAKNESINPKSVTIYTKSTLSDFVENGISNKEEYGEVTFTLKINPEKTKIEENAIKVNWTGNDAESIIILNKNENYNSKANTYTLKICANSLLAGRLTGNAKLIITVSQYGRTLTQEADITIKDAVKVSTIYNITKNQNNLSTNLIDYENAPKNVKYIKNNNQQVSIDFDYYVYFDSRDMQNGQITFDLNAKTDPTDALNSKLSYIYREFEYDNIKYENVLSINNNRVIIANSGLAFIDVCAADSFDAEANKYIIKKTVLVKVADGLSRSTALEISSISDLNKINQNVENLEKFYVVTKNLNLSTQNAFIPIGYINDNVYEFNGVFDGLMNDNFGEKVCATISGIKFTQNYKYLGLFAKLSSDAQVENLNVSISKIDVNTHSDTYFGGIAGESTGEIRSVTVNFINSNFAITENKLFVGGIAGKNNGTIYDCYTKGEIQISQNTAIETENLYVGGFVGENAGNINGNTNFFNEAEVIDSYNVELSITAKCNGYLGGIAGKSTGTISNVSFGGKLDGNNNIGGIVGYIAGDAYQTVLVNAFSSGIVIGNNNVGGLVGKFVGDIYNKSTITNVSVNMFDEENPTAHIIGQNFVGGLIGYAQNLDLYNAYARSYVDQQREGFEADMIVLGNDNSYAGGLVGYAKNTNIQKAYSIQKVSNPNNAQLGGLVGYGDTISLTDTFERNTATLTKLIVANSEGANNAEWFYSSNDGEFGIENISNPDRLIKNITLSTSWTGWSFTTNKNELSNNVWYKTNNDTYPYLIFEQNGTAKLLTVEAPTSIEISKKENVYLYQLKDENNVVLKDSFVLYRGKTNIIRFSSLFDVNVIPNDALLNVSKSITIVSSDSGIAQITGKTVNDYRLRLNSTGKVTLTISSKMNSEAKTTITLYVLDAVGDFELTYENNENLLVGSNYELTAKMSTSYVNNDNFYIKFTNNNNEHFAINNDISTIKYIKNNEKIFISASKSGNFSINYKLFVKLNIDGNEYEVPLGSDIGTGLDTTEKHLDFSFIYGIKDFVGEVNSVETGLNDIATLAYFLTGDDLRIVQNDEYYLPTIKHNFIGNQYWNLQFIYANVYFGETIKKTISCSELDDPAVLTKIENLTSIKEIDDQITKVEFIFELSVQKENVKNYFASCDANEIKVNKLTDDITFKASISNNSNSSNENAIKIETTTINIKRQKVDNVSLNFYTNAEQTKNGNDTIYTVNEVPSTAIVSGQKGLLKIALSPLNAEVKSVKVTYKNQNGYNMSINQMLKFTENDNKISYLDRLPYAVATDNGAGIILYHNESNYIENEIPSYDGYLYVNCIISSNVPAGQIFTVTVEAIYKGDYRQVDSTYSNDYKYTTSIDLVARKKSTLEIGYTFQNQTLNNYAVIPTDIQKEFYIDFTELIEPQDLNNLENIISPNAIGLTSENATIELAKNDDGSVKYTYISSSASYRVYYTIKTSNTEEIQLQSKFTKTKDAIQTTFQSDPFKFQPSDFVVTGISIVDGGNNTWSIPQTTPKQIDLQLEIDTSDENYEQTENGEKILNDDIKAEIDAIVNSIKTNFLYWFGKSQGENLYKTIDNENTYENYLVTKSNEIITIAVKNVDQKEILYCEIPLSYNNGTAELAQNTQDNSKIVSTIIGDHTVGFDFNGAIKNGEIQYLRDDVTMDLISDISSEHAIPISNQADFEKMNSGDEQGIMYYALNDNITLENYQPRDLEYISFDGNGYKITIKNFKRSEDSETVEKYDFESFGLFDDIDENSIVKNLTINYQSLTDLTPNKEDSKQYSSKLDTSNSNISTFSFGGVCVTNNGIIYNTKVEGNLEFVGDITKQTYIAGICDTNNGWISYSESNLSFTSNCGFTAGFVAVNTKKISNSKVVLNDNIENTLTNSDLSLTGGFVARNSGEIFGCYVSVSYDYVKTSDSTFDESKKYYELSYGSYLETSDTNFDSSKTYYEKANATIATISSRSTVGGFVNKNSGRISNSYSNVDIESETYASGFVYENTGTIESSYSSSSIQTSSSVHTPFTGTDESGNYLNLGTIDDCYYIGQYQSISGEPATKIEGTSDFAKFVFADKGKLNGTWRISGTSNPTLVDADLGIFCQQAYIGVETELDSEGNSISYHNWRFEGDNPAYGTLNNPRTITNIDTDNKNSNEWDSIITNYPNEYIIVLKDLTASREITPKTSELEFSGTLLGNNMRISNLYLRADSTNTNEYYGLFAKLSGATIKDMTLVARQVMANATNCVGTFAGYINNSNIINISVDGTNIDAVQGKNMVGAFAGLINDSIITKINVSGNVNAGYIGQVKNLKNYNNDENNDEIYKLTDNDYLNEVNYSYSGTFVGALVGDTTAKLINITGENKVIGFYSGSAVGLVDKNAKLILASTEIVSGQYVRAYAFAGGLVGENRGTIDRCFVAHNVSVQKNIDENTNNYNVISGRNLNFFVGSPLFVGGLVGFNNGGTIKNSYSKLDVRVSQYTTLASGGFVGLDVDGTISNSYATGSVTNMFIIGGFIGVETNSDFLLNNHQEKINDTDETTKIVRNDNHEIFDQENAYVSDKNSISLTNNLASNKWILPRNSSDINDAERLSQAATGFLIGIVVENTEAKDKVSDIYNRSVNFANVHNNHFNSQILKVSTRTNPIIIDSFSSADSAVLQSIISMDLNGKALVAEVNAHSIGGYTNSILSVGNNIEREDYKNTNDSEFDSNKTYYTWVEITDTTIFDISNAFERSETDGNYTYTKTPDTTYNSNKTYYTWVEITDTTIFDISNAYENKYVVANCTVNGVLVSFENILNKDELLLNKADGLFNNTSQNSNANWNNSYWNLPVYNDNLSPIYPSIIQNINV